MCAPRCSLGHWRKAARGLQESSSSLIDSLYRLASEHRVGVPLQVFARGPRIAGCRFANRQTVQSVIVAAVLKFASDRLARPDTKIRRHGHVPLVEKRVQIRSQEQAVVGRMGTQLAVRLDVRRLQNRQSSFVRDCTATFVGVDDGRSEGALTLVERAAASVCRNAAVPGAGHDAARAGLAARSQLVWPPQPVAIIAPSGSVVSSSLADLRGTSPVRREKVPSDRAVAKTAARAHSSRSDLRTSRSPCGSA